MPLFTSPIDGSPMRQIRRYGIELDVCTTSGGIWLDKGELEKILHLMSEDLELSRTSASGHTTHHAPAQHAAPQNFKHYDDDDARRYQQKGYYGSGKQHKKEGAFSRLTDLFDF